MYAAKKDGNDFDSIGFRYSKLLGVWICDKGDFEIEIPVEG